MGWEAGSKKSLPTFSSKSSTFAMPMSYLNILIFPLVDVVRLQIFLIVIFIINFRKWVNVTDKNQRKVYLLCKGISIESSFVFPTHF